MPGFRRTPHTSLVSGSGAHVGARDHDLLVVGEDLEGLVDVEQRGGRPSATSAQRESERISRTASMLSYHWMTAPSYGVSVRS